MDEKDKLFQSLRYLAVTITIGIILLIITGLASFITIGSHF